MSMALWALELAVIRLCVAAAVSSVLIVPPSPSSVYYISSSSGSSSGSVSILTIRISNNSITSH